MYKNQKISAILLMGGIGTRFDNAIPKQFHRIAGKKIYLHTLDQFILSQFFDEIIVVTPKKWKASVEKDINHSSLITVIEGGKTRQESAYLGICAAQFPLVMIHDAVRPFISQNIIEENIQKALDTKAVDTCISSADTIIEKNNNNMIEKIPKRHNMLRGQTPQTFHRSLIKKAHEEALKKGIHNASDDCQLVLLMGEKIAIAQGDEANIKITTPLDLFIAEQLFYLRSKKVSSKKRSLQGKIFAIVGGSGGIGTSIDQLLQKAGAQTIIISRSSAFYADLTYPDSLNDVFAQIKQKYGPLDGLINSGGILHAKLLADYSQEEIEKSIATNLTGLIFCCKYASLKKGASIINIASSSFSKGRELQSTYSAAKAGVVNFSQALAEERSDLLVNVIVPQRTNTPMRRKNFPKEDQKLLLSPQKVAKVVIALLQDPVTTGSIVEIRK